MKKTASVASFDNADVAAAASKIEALQLLLLKALPKFSKKTVLSLLLNSVMLTVLLLKLQLHRSPKLQTAAP